MPYILYFGNLSRVQTLAPSLVVDSEAFYAPTVQPGPVTVAPGLFTDTDSFYAPSVASQIIPALVTDGDQFYAPSVVGTVTLTPSLYSDTDSFYAPSIAVVLVPNLVSDAETFFAPTVTAGAVTITVPLYTDSDTFYAPAVYLAQTLQVSLYSDSETFFSPSIAIINILSPSLYTDADQIYAPSAIQTVVLFESQRAIDDETFYPPSITTVAYLLPSLEIDPFELIITPVDVSRILQPSIVLDTDAFFAPSFAGGNVFVFPPFLNFDAIIYVPSVLREKKQSGGGGPGGGGGVPQNLKYATSMVMTQSGLIIAIGATSERAQTINTRMMIYANSGGNPAALVAQSDVHTTSVLGDNTYTLNVPYSVANGQTIWIALHSDGDWKWFLSNQPGGSRFNTDSFVDGPSDPFGPISIDNKQAPVFAILLESATATITPPRYIDPETISAPSLTANAELITSFVIYDDAIYPPTLQEVNPVDPLHTSDIDSIYQPVVTASYQLLPGLVIDSDIVLQPTASSVGGIDQQVFSALKPSDDQIYAPTVTPVGANLLPSLYLDVDDIQPTAVSTYDELFIGDFEYDNDIIPPPDVSIGDWQLLPDLVIDEDVPFEPPETVTTGGDHIIEFALTIDQDSFYPPRIGQASIMRIVDIRGRRDSEADILGRLTSNILEDA